LGGHFVTGHVDCVGTIGSLKKIGRSIEFFVDFPEQFNSLLVAKGSIAVNGISLTVNELKNNKFSVNIIPFTQTETTMQSFVTGQKVNLEFDILAKYVGKFLDKSGKLSEENKVITINKLKESGW
jgi:riboflavin synthase